MSLLVPDVGEVEMLKRGLYGNGGTITNATNATPIVLTTGAAHGLAPGISIVVTDVPGNTAANGTFVTIATTSGTTITLGTISGSTINNVAGNGASTPGGTWSLAGMENIDLHLYSASHTPAETDTGGSYTEATFTNYALVTLNSKQSTTAGWATPTSVAPTGGWSAEAHVAESTYPQQSWTCGSTTNTIFGYYMTGHTSTTLLWAEAFASSVVLINGAIIQLTPRLGQS